MNQNFVWQVSLIYSIKLEIYLKNNQPAKLDSSKSGQRPETTICRAAPCTRITEVIWKMFKNICWDWKLKKTFRQRYVLKKIVSSKEEIWFRFLYFIPLITNCALVDFISRIRKQTNVLFEFVYILIDDFWPYFNWIHVFWAL